MSTPAADHLIGQQIETYCGKCKSATLHTVTAVKGEKISRVMCNNCNSYHLYRASTEKTAARSAAGKTTKTGKTPTRRSKMSWDNLVAMLQEGEVKDYAASGDFRLAKAIRHKTFGVGVITKVHTVTKIEVLFKDGTKLLGQNLDQAALATTVAEDAVRV